MKHSSLFFSFILIFLTSATQAQQFNWVKGGGSTATPSGAFSMYTTEAAVFMCTDPNGNVYALSKVNGNAIADTFSGVTYGSTANIILSSYNCSGQMRWAKMITAIGGGCGPYGITADSLGHIYVVGTLNGNTVYVGSTAVTGHQYQNHALLQFDSLGNFNWIRHLGANVPGNAGLPFGHASVCVDGSDNVHFFFAVRAGMQLSPSVLTQLGNYDVKYDVAGNLLSAGRLLFDSTLMMDGAFIDRSTNNVYVHGARNYTFWTGATPPGDSTASNFIAGFDVSRNLLWIDTMGGTFSTLGNVQSLIADGQGGLYASVVGFNNLSFLGTAYTPPAGTGPYMSFVTKLNTAGSIEWLSQADGTWDAAYCGVTLMGDHKVAATGYFHGHFTSGSLALYSTNISPVLTVFDTSGSMIATQRIHGNGTYDYGRCITADKIGNVYVGGSVSDTIPDTLITSYHSVGGWTDFFVLKYGVDCNCTAMPTAAYTYTLTGLNTVNATYSGTTPGAVDSVVWNWGDGTKGYGLAASHTYTVVGAVNVCATVYTACGYDTKCGSILVNCPGPPTVSFNTTGTSVIGFTYTGSTLALDSVKWDYGDGHTGIGITSSHAYSASSTYTVCATAYTGCGSNTACDVITVSCTPLSSFTHAGVPLVGFNYTGSLIGVDSVVWDFGDGGDATGISPSHTYGSIGTYTVCATVYTTCGSDDRCMVVDIPCVAAPMAAFADTGSLAVGYTYTGTMAAVDSVKWDFGDGGTANGVTAVHSYSASGTYHACVTVYTPCGSDSVCREITVQGLGISATLKMTEPKIWPNPINDELHFDGVSALSAYRITNMVGTVLLHGGLGAGHNVMRVGDLPAGVYIVEVIRSEGQRVVRKVIKQ